MASEARQASLIAIAKKDVPAKHWSSLSRTLTTLGKFKGLISWSGTSFEYLMPNINIPKYKGSLLDESCKFMVMSQMEYAKKLQIPWGISEAAFNLKDLHSNYQYKAFGIPWLGLKRGLADEMVVSAYGSVLAINAVDILLQERMPDTAIITKESKEKVEKLKYIDYEDYIKDTYKKIDERLIRGNVISSENYSIAMNQKGEGVSIYNNKLINRFKNTEDYSQGIFFAIKDIKTKEIWGSNYTESNKYQISFMPDKIEQEMINRNIKTKIETIIAPDEPVEIRKVTLENLGNEEEILEITSYFEPVLSSKEQDYAHPAFNNLFLLFDYENETNSIIVRRRKRSENEQEIYMGANLYTNSETIGDLEYEIDAEKFIRKRKYRNTTNGKKLKSSFKKNGTSN